MTPPAPSPPLTPRPRRAFHPGLLAGLAHSLGTLCMYREDAPWLGLVMLGAVVLITFVAARSPRPFRTALGVYLGCVPGTYLNHLFMAEYATAGYLLLPYEFALFPAGFAWLVGRLNAKGVVPDLGLVSAVWVGFEYLRGELVLGGNPWFTLAHITTGVPGIMMAASWGGAYLVSALVVVAGLIVGFAPLAIRASARVGGFERGAVIVRLVTLPVVAGVLILIAGHRNSLQHPRILKVAAIQTNLSRAGKEKREIEDLWESSQRWYELSRRAAAAGAQVIVWPETMFAGLALDAGTQATLVKEQLFYPTKFENGAGPTRIFLTSFYDDLVALQREINVPMLVGSVAYENLAILKDPQRIRYTHDHRFNSVFLIHNGAVDPARYDKLRLVPFGEYLPLIQYIPGATKWVASTVGSLVPLDATPGKVSRVFDIPREAGGAGGAVTPARVVTPICFEAMYGSTCRALAYQNGERVADILINPSNDNWFGETAWSRHWIRYAHLANASWRCAELGLPMVRAVNTGRSCLIDSRGVVINDRLSDQPVSQEFNDNTEGFAVYDVPLPDPEFKGTLYSRIGDVVPWTCVGVTGFAAVWTLVRGARSGARAKTEPAQ